MKPPFAYYGGKTFLAPAIADLLPAHKGYVEPFAGSLAVLLAKPPVESETVNDLDGRLMTFWRVLRDRPEDLYRACALTPHSRAELAFAGDAPLLGDEDEVEVARRVWVILTQSRSHSMKATGWWYRAAPKAFTPSRYSMAYADRIPAAAERLRSVALENRDGIDVIRAYGKDPDNLLYLDPPYLGSTRASNYAHEMTTDDRHRELSDAANACKATVVVSGYDSDLYRDLFSGWYVTRMRGATTLSGETDRIEVLWSNRPLSVEHELDDLI